MQVPAPLTEVADFATTSGSNVPGKLEAYGYVTEFEVCQSLVDGRSRHETGAFGHLLRQEGVSSNELRCGDAIEC
ncbi:unnamed protein product [Peronospora farinosa]|uniref:Uncharacterized protein n=1 Tax=Peronospora farinosa TaxID=134698 RepID=A0ABN8CA38_9STRA|nr:unnamed protein product [Peronospora farinosa]